jgi:hypothetical protein
MRRIPRRAASAIAFAMLAAAFFFVALHLPDPSETSRLSFMLFFSTLIASTLGGTAAGIGALLVLFTPRRSSE